MKNEASLNVMSYSSIREEGVLFDEKIYDRRRGSALGLSSVVPASHIVDIVDLHSGRLT